MVIWMMNKMWDKISSECFQLFLKKLSLKSMWRNIYIFKNINHLRLLKSLYTENEWYTSIVKKVNTFKSKFSEYNYCNLSNYNMPSTIMLLVDDNTKVIFRSITRNSILKLSNCLFTPAKQGWRRNWGAQWETGWFVGWFYS